MRIMSKKLTLGFAVCFLIAALVVPAAALAAQGQSAAAAGEKSAVVASAGSQRLEQRVMTALQNRAKRFENYAAMLERTQTRLLAFCETAEKAGADCDAVREQLQLATQTMEQARVQEQLAIQTFKGVPDAENMRGAFQQARVQARVSVQTMKQSRDQMKTAAGLLKDIVEDLVDDVDGV